MSQSVTKGAKKNTVSNSAKARKPSSVIDSAKTLTRATAAKKVKLAASDKAPARKAEKKIKAVAKTAALKTATSKTTTRKSSSDKSSAVKKLRVAPAKNTRTDRTAQKNKTVRATQATKTSVKPSIKAMSGVAAKSTLSKSATSSSTRGTTKNKPVASAAPPAGKNRVGKVASSSVKSIAPPQSASQRTATQTQSTPRQPTRDEAAALRAFERAHKAFTRGHFTEAGQHFRQLIADYGSATEVVARSRTYLSIAEARSRAAAELPHDADALYDRGVVELNRGDYVAAQELFERALKREPEAAHIHYGLAVVRTRLGAIPAALESLARAVSFQQMLRIRAQQDQDLAPLRNEPDFEQLVSASR